MDLEISQYSKPVYIAELSGNHGGDIKRAKTLIQNAKLSGADFVKIQTYKPSTITVQSDRSEFVISEHDSPWKGRSLWDVYQEAHTPWDWHPELFDYARSIGITLFSSPFDLTAIELLEKCKCPIYKVASFEITEKEILQSIGATKKPVIMSTGMADIAEISNAINTLRSSGSTQIILLKCTSSYPAPIEDANIKTIPHLHKIFGLPCGLSDHCNNHAVAASAVALGAPIIEKHFRLEGDFDSIDSSFSFDNKEFSNMVNMCNSVFKALGKPIYGGSSSDKRFRKDRRSIYIIKDVKEGETVTRNNVRSIRPGYGLPVNMMSIVLGKKFLKDIKKGEPLTFDHLMKQ